MSLTGKQRRALRALGHHLSPVVMLGREGVTPAVVLSADRALTDHELIKIKVGDACPIGQDEAAAVLGLQTGADVAQVLGRTALLYRAHPEKPKIVLPVAKPGEKEEPGDAIGEELEAAMGGGTEPESEEAAPAPAKVSPSPPRAKKGGKKGKKRK